MRMVEEEWFDSLLGEGDGEGDDSTKKEVRLISAVSDAPATSPSISRLSGNTVVEGWVVFV